MKDELKEGERLLSKHHKSLIKEMEKETRKGFSSGKK